MGFRGGGSGGGGPTPNLASVLAVGNSAGTQKITGLVNGSSAQDAAAYGQIVSAAGVATWNGRSGTVIPLSGDYTYQQISNTPTPLTATPVKTGAYNANPADLVLCDPSGGAFTVTLPTAPADGTVIATEVVKRVTTGAPTYVTVAAGGSDVFYLASTGPTSVLVGRGTVAWVYKASTAIWQLLWPDGNLPIGWEFGRDSAGGSNISISSTSATAPTTVISCAAHIFDGEPVELRFGCISLLPPATAGATMEVSFYEPSVSSTAITALLYSDNNVSAGIDFPGPSFSYPFTPTAGSHTYLIGAYVSSTTGTIAVPSFARFVKI